MGVRFDETSRYQSIIYFVISRLILHVLYSSSFYLCLSPIFSHLDHKTAHSFPCLKKISCVLILHVGPDESQGYAPHWPWPHLSLWGLSPRLSCPCLQLLLTAPLSTSLISTPLENHTHIPKHLLNVSCTYKSRKSILSHYIFSLIKQQHKTP